MAIRVDNRPVYNGLRPFALEESAIPPAHAERFQRDDGNPYEEGLTPLHRSISHETIYTFLQAKVPDLFTLWEELAQDFAQYEKASRSSFLREKRVLERLKEIHNMIQSAYAQITLRDLMHFDNAAGLTPILAKIEAKGAYLMINSASSPAGDNTSLRYVQPNIDAFFETSCELLSSYFTPSSLTHQIEAGNNPFERIPPLSLLLDERNGAEALHFLEDCFHSPELFDARKEEYLSLFKSLSEQGLFFDELFTLAKRMRSQAPHSLYARLIQHELPSWIFEKARERIEEEKEIERVVTLAQKIASSEDPLLQKHATSLFTQLVAKKFHLEEAFTHAKNECLVFQQQRAGYIPFPLRELLSRLIQGGYRKEIEAFAESIHREEEEILSLQLEPEGISTDLTRLLRSLT